MPGSHNRRQMRYGQSSACNKKAESMTHDESLAEILLELLDVLPMPVITSVSGCIVPYLFFCNQEGNDYFCIRA